MAALFTCPQCRRTGRLPEAFTGTRVKCPGCGAIATIPGDESQAQAVESGYEPILPAPKPVAPRPRPRPQPEPVEEEEETPWTRSPVALAGAGAGAMVVIAGLVAFLLRPTPTPAPDDRPPAVPAQAPAVAVVDPVPAAEPAPAPAARIASGGAPPRPLDDPPAPVPAQAPALPAPAPTSTAETVRLVKDATVFIKAAVDKIQGTGSGFVIRVEGDSLLVATNHHVVNPHMEKDEDDADPRLSKMKVRLTAVFRSGEGRAVEQSAPAEVIASERRGNRDLAILRVRGIKDPPRPIPFDQAPDLSLTTPVLIFGFPFGNIDRMFDPSGKHNPSATINKGSISNVQKDDAGRTTYVQIDGSLNPGNSGGPVVDERGRLVGVAVAQIRNTTIGFAIPPAELAGMLDGRVGRIGLAMKGESAGMADIQAEAQVIDPLGRIRSVELLYAPAVGNAKRPNGSDSDGSSPPIPGASRVGLSINGRLASGSFRAAVGGGPSGRKLLIQAATTDSNGRVSYSEPMPHTLSAKPSGMASVGGPEPSDSGLTGRSFAALGSTLFDPARDCKLSVESDSATIRVPAGVHLLSDELDVKNSPMALVGVEGDFIAQVRVPGTMLPGTLPARTKGGKVLPFTYMGAGLVLWGDRDNYLRLERSAKAIKGRATLESQVLVEVCKRGQPQGYFYANIPDGPLFVRIVRIEGGLHCMFGPDGRRWVSLKKLATPFPDKLRVGLTASNASLEVLTARFEDFALITEKKEVEEANKP